MHNTGGQNFMMTKSPSSPSVAKVLIVDDHPLVRRGLAELVSKEPDLQVTGEAAGASEALGQMQANRPDLVIIDLSLQEGSGLDLIKQIKAIDDSIKVLVSSMHDESLFAERSIRAGASGYIHKEEATEKVIEAIRYVLKGKVYLSEDMSERILHQFAGIEDLPPEGSISKLSNRELEVFGLIGQGLSTRQIAEKLHRSIKTIETYRESIKQKLNLRTSNELIRHAVQWELEKQ
jgi:DNA-binding NarL/FixJ family response regulator